MKLNIDKPCSEDWSSMKIGMVSRHCNACVKDVFDFSKMTKEEILIFLIENQNSSVCGRLKKSQLDFHYNELEVIVNGLRTQKNNKYAFAILSLACLTLISCNDPVSDKSNEINNVQTKKVVIEQVDTSETITEIKDSIIEKPVCETLKNHRLELKTDSNNSIVNLEEDWIQGDIEIAFVDSVNAIYTFVDKMPEFVGGIDSLFSFLGNNLVYPEIEKASNIHGKAYVNFVVDKDGSVVKPIILRGLTDNCDKEVIRVMKLMPKWIPGEHKGEKVKVSYNLPINFSLSNK